MKFASPYSNLSEVIKKFTYEGDHFHIEYFDGTSTDYICYSPERVEMVKEKMLFQAFERQDDYDHYPFKLKEDVTMFFSLMATILFGRGIINDEAAPTVIGLLTIGLCLRSCIKTAQLKKELEKYRIFFDLYDHLDEINNGKFMECIEADHFYQKMLDIDTVDDFSLGEIKTLKRNLDATKNGN